MIGKPLSPGVRLGVMILSLIIILAGYSGLSYKQHVKNPQDKTIPTWNQLREGTIRIFEKNRRSGEIWILVDSKASAKRLFWGLLWGIAGAVLIGVATGCFPFIEAFLAQPLAILAKLPPTAALALFFVMLGTGTGMYVGIIVVGTLPVLSQSIYLAIKDVPKEPMDYASLQGQKEEITRAVFDPGYVKDRDEFRKFWDEIQDEEINIHE